MLPRASLFCFVFVFLLSFESVSAKEPVVPTVMNGTVSDFSHPCVCFYLAPVVPESLNETAVLFAYFSVPQTHCIDLSFPKLFSK